MLNRILSASRRLPLGPRLRAKTRMGFVRAFPRLFPRWASPGADPGAVSPGQPRPGKADVLFFGVIDWHFRFQRPQHFATNLVAEGHRVFYVSSLLLPKRPPGFRVEAVGNSGRLFQVFLNAWDLAAIYYGLPSAATQAQLNLGCARVLQWAQCAAPIALVQHPCWFRTAAAIPGRLLAYDRMDFHEGFGDFPPDLRAAEESLIRQADVTFVSSAWLDDQTAPLSDRRALIRNAGDYTHFATTPPQSFAEPGFSRVIGYYGAIAPWVDLELLDAVAERFPDALVLLIGHDQVQAAGRLRHRANIRLIGEVPYQDLPFYLSGFDVCLLPFRVGPLTLATNPVKVYEYLSSGLPVVATDLPEMRQFGELIDLAGTLPEFLAGIARALQEPADDPMRLRRRQYAEQQTWQRRSQDLLTALAGAGDRAGSEP